MGLVFIRELADGHMSARKVAKKYHRGLHTVRKYVTEAVGALMDDTQEKIIQELLPIAIKNIKAHMEMQIQLAKDGKLPDVGVAAGVLKSMYIFDAPVERTSAVKDLADAANDGGLAALMVARPEPKQLREARENRKNALSHKVEVIDVTPPSDSPDSKPVDPVEVRFIQGISGRERADVRSGGTEWPKRISELNAEGRSSGGEAPDSHDNPLIESQS